MTITIWIIIITVGVSILAFRNYELFDKLLLSPYMVVHRKEWYRTITHGFLHADWFHLFVNMFVLYYFGKYVESAFGYITHRWLFHYIVLYFGGMIVASIPSIIKYKNVYAYRSVGASGAVSALLFAYIFFEPWNMVYIMAILPIPSIIFGVLYLAYSSYMSKRGGDNVNHDAHFFGAVFGFLYPLIIEPGLFRVFIYNLLHP